jgi:hypothetical protein
MNRMEHLEAKVAAMELRLRRAGEAPFHGKRCDSDGEAFRKACEVVGQDPAAIRSARRTRELSACRRVVAEMLARNLGWGVRRIARAMGKSHVAVQKMVDSYQ